MKRILYVYFGDFDAQSGVTYKLKGLFAALDLKAVEWTLFALSTAAKTSGYSSKNLYTLPITSYNDQDLFYKELNDFLLTNIYDIYFFRYPSVNSSLISFLKKHPNKFIFEHNTKELPEIKENALYWMRKFKFKPTPSYLSLIVNSLIKPIFNEAYYGKTALRLAKKGVAVTKEISLYEMSRFKKYNCGILSNGIDVSKIKISSRKFEDGEVLNLIMLVSNNNVWHGVDLVIESLNKYPDARIKLFLIGEIDDSIKSRAQQNKNITLTGFLSQAEFETYMIKAHIGIGSIALHRINMEEASTLKVREYLASGLPVCLGYNDTDIQESEIFKKHSLKIDTRIESLNWDKIYDWAVALYKGREISKILRDEAFRKIDFSVKAQLLLSQ